MLSSFSQSRKQVYNQESISMTFTSNNLASIGHLTFQDRLALFKLRKKPRQQIRLRFSTILKGLELPGIENTSFVKSLAEIKITEKFKVKQKDNLSNAKNYLNMGNKISIYDKKPLKMFEAQVEQDGESLERQRASRVSNIADLTALLALQQKENKSSFARDREIQNLNGTSSESSYTTNREKFTDYSPRKLEKIGNQYKQLKNIQEIYRQTLKLNQSLRRLKGNVILKSQQVLDLTE